MIPDKIYFNPKFDIPQREKECSDDIEYIRIDALLEWAERRKETYMELANKSGDGVEWGQECAFEEVIDKLNSL